MHASINVRKWALADWQLSCPTAAGRLLGTMDAREGPERQGGGKRTVCDWTLDGHHNHALTSRIYAFGFFHRTVQIVGLTSPPGGRE
jgi:hypothetical protein